jgi:ribonuclease Z
MRIVGLWLTVVLAICLPAMASAQVPVFRVHLLGTGGPELTPNRAGYSTLIEAPGLGDADGLLLFDVGREALERLYQQRINPKRITRIYLTHLHSDHISGLPDLWMTPWFLLGRTTPLEIWGPPGTAAMVDGMRAMYGHDVINRQNPFNSAEGIAIKVHEIPPGVVTDDKGVRVRAFAVEHADGDPAYGYRIERAGRVVTLSGDATLTDGLIAGARGADLLVQNVIAFSPRLSAIPEMQGVLAKLTTPEQAGQLIKDAAPTLTVFSHIVKKELPGAAGDATILNRVRATGERGRIAMGQDRDVIEIGASVSLSPPRSLAGLPELDSKSAGF